MIGPTATATALLVLLSAAPRVPDDEATARALVKEARLAFDAGDFTTALAKYEEAFRIKPVPALQFNLGQCHRQLGHPQRALYFFQRFLDANPPEAQAAQVRPLIEEVQAQLAERDRQKKEQEEHDRRLELEHAKLTSAEAQAKAAATAAEEARRRAELERALKLEPVQEPPPYRKVWFWAVVGGAVAVAAGVGAGVYVGTAPKPVPTTWPDINAR